MRKHKNKYNLNEKVFESIDSQEKAYLLGFLYADGSNTGRYSVSLAVQKRDIEILHRMKEIIDCDYPIKIQRISLINKNWSDMAKLSICSKKICEDLINLGCVRNKTHFIRFPSFLDESLIRHFIRGYFDGDGSIYISKHNVFGFSIRSNPEFCKDLSEILIKNIDIYPYLRNVSGVTGNINGNLEVTGRLQIIKIMTWLYEGSSIHLSRKYKKYLDFINYDNKWFCKRISQLNVNGELVKEYKNTLEASQKTGIPKSNIHKVASGGFYQQNGIKYQRHTAGGFIWKYV